MLDTEIIKVLSKELPFWDELSDSEVDLLLSDTRLIRYKQGERIHSPSNECAGVLLVRSGELRTYLLSETGKEVTLFRLDEEGACILSASCLLSNITFDVFIDAQLNTEVIFISSFVFAQLQNRNLHVENFALRLAVDRFSDVMWAMEQILFMSFDARLAMFLLDETSKTGESNIILTHEQIAKYIGSAREVVSRMLKYFEKEKFVRLYRGGLEITNKPALKNLVYIKSK